MTRLEGVLGYQVKSMIDGISRDAAQRKRAIMAEAQQQADELLRRTRRQCRQRGQRAVAEERALMAAALAKTDAALASRRRRRQQAIDAERLDRGYDCLRQALLSRWQASDTRTCWMDAALDQAIAILPADNWHVEYADSLNEATLAESLATRQRDATLARAPGIEAGLRVRRDSACLDMTLAGLMSRDLSLSGDLLAEVYALDARATENDDG